MTAELSTQTNTEHTHASEFESWARKNPEAALLINMFKEHTKHGSTNLLPTRTNQERRVLGEVSLEDGSAIIIWLEYHPLDDEVTLEVRGAKDDPSTADSLGGIVQINAKYRSEKTTNAQAKTIKLRISKPQFLAPVRVNQFNWLMDFLMEFNRRSSEIPEAFQTNLHRANY